MIISFLYRHYHYALGYQAEIEAMYSTPSGQESKQVGISHIKEYCHNQDQPPRVVLSRVVSFTAPENAQISYKVYY